MPFGFRWTERTSPALAATTITACWTLTLALGALVAAVLGADVVREWLAEAAVVLGAVTLAFGLMSLAVSVRFGARRPIRAIGAVRGH